MPRAAFSTVVCALSAALLLFGTGCSGNDGDGGGGGGPTGLRATIQGVDNQFLARFGVVGITYTVSGPANALFDVLHQFSGTGSSLLGSASQIPGSLGATITTDPVNNPGGVVVGQVPVTGLLLPASNGETPMTGGDVTSPPITFWWYAFGDLGFLPGNFNFLVTPTVGGNPNAPGLAGTTGAIPYGGAPTNASTASSGPSVGDPGLTGGPTGSATNGRAGQTATAVRSTSNPNPSAANVLVAGGYNDGSVPNGFDSADRFALNIGSHAIPFSGSVGAPRALHASSHFIDPTTGTVRVLVTGGVNSASPVALNTVPPNLIAAQVAGATAESATGAVYSFAPVEIVGAVGNSMTTSRFGHTATWSSCNQVIIVGGCTNLAGPTALSSIEHYDPVTNTFFRPNNSQAQPVSLGTNMERCGHAAAMLGDGRVFVVGGYNPASPLQAMPAVIYDPISGDAVSAGGGSVQLRLVGHTATRLANGWILVVGGRVPSTGTLNDLAYVYQPETDTFVNIDTNDGRAFHTATYLGNKSVLVTGGVTVQNGLEGFTSSAQVFTLDNTFAAGFTSTTVFDVLADARAEHTATATDSGAVFVIGGRNEAGGTPSFLATVESLAFSNAVPTVTSAMTSAAPAPGAAGTMNIDVDVTDVNQDGGYLIIRYRDLSLSSSGPFCSATIVAQSPSTAGGTTPNLEVNPGSYAFTWDFGADGVASGSSVEIEIIPVGAVLGSPVRFLAVAQ